MFSTELNEAQQFLFVVGGIGITPVMSMLRTLADRGDRRPCRLLYGVGHLDEVTFDDVVAELQQTLDLELVVVPIEAPDGWTGPSGFIDAGLLAEHLADRREAVQCFVCGPDVMMDSVEQVVEDLGVPLDHVNLERFVFAERITSMRHRLARFFVFVLVFVSASGLLATAAVFALARN